jgi:hypothetical protein
MRQPTLVERHHPIFSPIAIISTLLLAASLGVIIFLTGGRAFNPGDLSAISNGGESIEGYKTHAEFGGDCGQCHAPFKGIEAARCEICHKNIGQDRNSGDGLHGRLKLAEDCASCHLDHRGSDFNLLTIAIDEFDHDVTRFSLVLHQLDYDGFSLACIYCHTDETHYTLSLTACIECHETAAPDFMALHLETYGSDCIGCHDGLDTIAQFSLAEHDQVFALTGIHKETACENCHLKGQFEGTPQECATCHEEPVEHLGLFGVGCDECHTAEGWQPAVLNGQAFEHAETTGFSLVTHLVNYDDSPFTCRTCHASENDFAFDKPKCAACHNTADPLFIDEHTAQFGDDCLACHDGTGELVDFDHALIWPLDGQHAVIDCTGCHIDRVFRGTPRECIACHEEPAIHAGLFGLDCVNCHTAVAWQPAQLMQHIFLLDHGGEGEIDCATCHTNTYTEYTCYSCHEHEQAEIENKHLEEGYSLQEISNCIECHPTGREGEAENEAD